MSTLINVLGAPRTGSTLLDVTLGNGEDIFSCGEVSFYFRPMRKHDFHLSCSCANSDCKVWEELSGIAENQFHNYLLDRNKFVVDSSKNLVWVIDSLDNLNPTHKGINLVTWKSEKKILYSHWKRGENLKNVFRNYIKYYTDLLSTRLSFYSVNHQDLIEDPVRVLKRIEELTGIRYFEGKEKFWQQENHHFLFGSHGIRQQVQSGASRLYQEKFDQEYEAFFKENKDYFLGIKGAKEVMGRIRSQSIFSSSPVRNKVSAARRPLWYYYKKIGRKLLRYFPKEYDVKDVNPVYGKR